jgi:hypothetical protein
LHRNVEQHATAAAAHDGRGDSVPLLNGFMLQFQVFPLQQLGIRRTQQRAIRFGFALCDGNPLLGFGLCRANLVLIGRRHDKCGVFTHHHQATWMSACTALVPSVARLRGKDDIFKESWDKNVRQPVRECHEENHVQLVSARDTRAHPDILGDRSRVIDRQCMDDYRGPHVPM